MNYKIYHNYYLTPRYKAYYNYYLIPKYQVFPLDISY